MGEENARKAEDAEERMKEMRDDHDAEEDAANRKIIQLQKELEEEKQKPVATAIVKEVPEEMKQKMAAMEEELEALKAKGEKDKNESAFAFAFEEVKRNAQRMLQAAEGMEAEKQAKYLKGAKKFFEMMVKTVEEEM